jgi:signal transduction histidine kinase
VASYPPEAAFAGLRERLLRELALLALLGGIVAFISWRLGFLALDRAERYQTLFSSMEEGFCLYRALQDGGGEPRDFVRVDANPAAQRMIGIPSENLVGRGIREDTSGVDSGWLDVFRWVAKTGLPIRHEGYLQDRDRWFRLHAFSPGRGLVAALFADVTERRSAEAERERLLLTEQEARTQAEEALRAREEFLSIAAHELKTPVTSLHGYSQLLARQFEQTGTIDPSQGARAVWHMNQQSERLKRLTEQLLDVSRLDAGKLALSPEETDLAALAAGVVDRARHAHPERVFVYRDGADLSAMVDGLRLEQVLSNLLDNAMKFSGRDMPIEVTVEAGATGWIEIAVRDHGDGVPEGDRERIFERFYQADGERHSGGMGIGLFVSRQTVEMHGGSIRCENADGGGSRFVVRIPAVRSRPEAGTAGGSD